MPTKKVSLCLSRLCHRGLDRFVQQRQQLVPHARPSGVGMQRRAKSQKRRNITYRADVRSGLRNTVRNPAPCETHTQPQFVLGLFLLLNASESRSGTACNGQQRITTLRRPSAPGASVNLSTRRWFQWATSQETRVHSQNRRKKGTGY